MGHKKVFDTSFDFCPNETCVTYEFLTTSYILDETLTLIRSRLGGREISLDFLRLSLYIQDISANVSRVTSIGGDECCRTTVFSALDADG